MCQGVICSMVKWDTKSVILVGVGSHSKLLADNRHKLKRLGWSEGAKNQSVISIESDFQKGYGTYTVESGNPSVVELQRLARAYDKCAGSAKRLIAHVEKYGYDAALENLLNETARDDYHAKVEALQDDYDTKLNPVENDYNAKLKALQDDYDAKAEALQDDCDAKLKTLRDDYDAKLKALWLNLFRQEKNRRF